MLCVFFVRIDVQVYGSLILGDFDALVGDLEVVAQAIRTQLAKLEARL
ncbi:hypothetical protein Hanom_Chr00s129461g01814821 [Helianthus anomalus]